MSDAVVRAVDEAVDGAQADAADMKSTAAQKMADAKASVAQAREALQAVSADAAAAQAEVPNAQVALTSAEAGIRNAASGLDAISGLAADLQQRLMQLTAEATPQVSSAILAVSHASANANAAIGAAAGDVQAAQGAVDASIQQARIVLAQSEQLAQQVRASADALPDTDPAKQALLEAANVLDSRNQELSGNLSGLESVSASIASSAASASLSAAVTGMQGAAHEARLLLDQLSGTLASTADAAGQTDALLADLEGQLDSLYVDITALDVSSSLASYFGVDGLDADKIASFMGSPTELVTEEPVSYTHLS